MTKRSWPAPTDDLYGWKGAREAQLRASRSATPGQRLEALEELMELAYQAGALPLKRDPQGRPLSPTGRLALKKAVVSKPQG